VVGAVTNTYGRRLLKRFEDAARQHEMRGMYTGPEGIYEQIVAEYERARLEMLRYLDRRVKP
jgi:hypothetical protein